MSRKMVVMLLPIQKGASLRANTSNMHKYINKIPCEAENIIKLGGCMEYVKEEMEEYPFRKRAQSESKISSNLK